MRKKIVAGNWKMNKNLQEGIALVKELKEVVKNPKCDVVICTPFIHLATVAEMLKGTPIQLGAENCADKASGAYTGEVSAEMVKSTGAQYVILGHSERRQYYGETGEILKEKVQLALQNDLKVLYCIGESLEEREANKQNEVVKKELEESVFNLSADEFAKIVIAYEPIWAIGTGKTATAVQAERYMPTYASAWQRNTEHRWLTTPQSSMVAPARQAMHQNYSLSLTSTVVSLAVLRSRQQTSMASLKHGIDD